MRIPDGDLVPARRRAYRGGYGRRRRPLRRLAVVVVLLLAAAAVTWFLRRDTSPATPAAACPQPTASSAAPVALPAPGQVRLVLLNGTTHTGLAKDVSGLLAARGFVVLTQGNAPSAVAGASVITYGPSGEPAATVLARQVPGVRLASAPGARRGTLQLVLGGDYRRLATAAEVTAAAAASPPPVLRPAPTRSPCAG